LTMWKESILFILFNYWCLQVISWFRCPLYSCFYSKAWRWRLFGKLV